MKECKELQHARSFISEQNYSLPVHQSHFSHALPLPRLYLLILLPRDPLPGAKECKRGSTKNRSFPPSSLSSSSSSFSFFFAGPLAHNNSSNPKRVPESYWTLLWVYACLMWMSVQPLDRTRTESVCCWLHLLLSSAKKFWNTLYKAKKVAWGSLWFRYPKRESKKPSWGRQ